MLWDAAGRAVGAPRSRSRRSLGMIAAAALALAGSGCASPPGALGPTAVISGTSVTFDSIDGPPPEVFRRLVANLNEEAEARKIPVVARSASATYRVRGYVAATVERGKTTFGWVWDIYDADKRRALRIAGEEPAAPGRHRNAWTAADDAVLRRMATSGMERLAAFLNKSPEAPAAEPEPPGATLLVSMRDDSPEAAGIVRPSGPSETTGSAVSPSPAPDAAAAPAGPNTPGRRGTRSSLAAATAGPR